MSELRRLPGGIGEFHLPPVGRGDSGYDEARRTWNALHDRSPAWIVRCGSSAEVATAVRFARSRGLPLAVRGGGHSFPGYGSCDGGVVIDLAPMSAVRIDVERAVAEVGGGATWGSVDAETSRLGFAIPGGVVSTTGVGGLTLGGGIGWLSRPFGLSCDQLVGAEVVLADGAVVEADESSAPDLLWALRGGGGNFGIVSRFDLRLRELPPDGEVLGGMVLYPAEAAETVLRDGAALLASAPDELTVLIAFVNVPPLPFLPEAIHFAPAVAVALCDLGRSAEAERRSLPLRRLAQPLADLVRRLPWVEQQRLFDGGAPPGLRQYGVGANLERLTDASIAAVAEQSARRPTPLCQIHLHQLGGAVSRIAEDATAYSGRSAAWIVHVIATWEDRRDDDRARAWARETRARLRATASSQTYLNFLGESRGDEVRRAFGDAKYERLRQIKRRYDPDNLFRVNANIVPGA